METNYRTEVQYAAWAGQTESILRVVEAIEKAITRADGERVAAMWSDFERTSPTYSVFTAEDFQSFLTVRAQATVSTSSDVFTLDGDIEEVLSEATVAGALLSLELSTSVSYYFKRTLTVTVRFRRGASYLSKGVQVEIDAADSYVGAGLSRELANIIEQDVPRWGWLRTWKMAAVIFVLTYLPVILYYHWRPFAAPRSDLPAIGLIAFVGIANFFAAEFIATHWLPGFEITAAGEHSRGTLNIARAISAYVIFVGTASLIATLWI